MTLPPISILTLAFYPESIRLKASLWRGVKGGQRGHIFKRQYLFSDRPHRSWWQIDELGFNQQFFSNLSLINSGFALFGMFFFRWFMAEKSIIYVVGFLTIVGRLLSLPIARLYFGFHRWTSALTGNIVNARFIALVDTALESPLGQVAMTPMPARIAQSAPPLLKATYFAAMASSTNLALPFNNLGTKYLNQLYVVSRPALNMVSCFEENT